MNLLSWNMFVSLLCSYFLQKHRIQSLNSGQKSHVLGSLKFNKPSFPSSLCFKPRRLIPLKEAYLELVAVGRVLGQPFFYTSLQYSLAVRWDAPTFSWRTSEPNSACVHHCPGAITVLEWTCYTLFALGEGEVGFKTMSEGMDNLSETKTESQVWSYSSSQRLPVVLSPGEHFSVLLMVLLTLL